MRALAQRFYSKPQYSKIIEWGKLITITGSAQILIQILGLVSGILIIRVLPTQEYALYTIANTLLGTMSVLSDSGIANGVISQGGQVWQNRLELGKILSTGLSLRRNFALLSLLIIIPILMYLLLHNNASWLTSILITLSIIITFVATITDTILEVAPKLHQDILSLQKNQIGANLGKFIFISIVFIFPFSFIAILAGGIPRMYANYKLRKISSRYADLSQNPQNVIKVKINSIVKRTLPGVIYYCFYSQITIWLISLFGDTTSLAQIGALGRIAILVNIFSVLFGIIIAPRFAKLPENSILISKRYFQINTFLIVISICLIAISWLFPTEVLWILGKQYSNLENELLLFIVGSCLNLISGSSLTLFAHRGWVIKPLISIPVIVLATLICPFFINISSLKGVLVFNILISILHVILYVIYFAYKISELKKLSIKN